MKTTVIKESIEIDTPRERVWEVLFKDKYTRIWYSEFSEGAYAETDWKLGSKVTCKDDSGSGVFGKVVVCRPNEALSIEYQGILTDGKEDYDSPGAIDLKGRRETYRLTEKGGITHLTTECDMGAEFFEYMTAAWAKAVRKVKELAEAG
jgi:uncharacterized protein YndB with AHSA1/START domain